MMELSYALHGASNEWLTNNVCKQHISKSVKQNVPSAFSCASAGNLFFNLWIVSMCSKLYLGYPGSVQLSIKLAQSYFMGISLSSFDILDMLHQQHILGSV